MFFLKIISGISTMLHKSDCNNVLQNEEKFFYSNLEYYLAILNISVPNRKYEKQKSPESLNLS